MRRYRMINGTFDTRSHFIVDEIHPDWELQVRSLHWANRVGVLNGLKHEFGEEDLGQKVAEFAALGPEPFSVLAYHNLFFRQVRRSFVFGSYYPALVCCCALGERILNHMIHEFRDDFKSTPEYKRVYDKESFDDWNSAIDVLEAWKILLPEVAIEYRSLRGQRNAAIHFRPETSTNARDMALESIMSLGDIISRQFGSVGAQPWYFNSPGETYIKKDAEECPFVRRILIPSALRVGPKYVLGFNEGSHEFVVTDIGDFGPDDGTDDEFTHCGPAHGLGRPRSSRCPPSIENSGNAFVETTPVFSLVPKRWATWS